MEGKNPQHDNNIQKPYGEGFNLETSFQQFELDLSELRLLVIAPSNFEEKNTERTYRLIKDKCKEIGIINNNTKGKILEDTELRLETINTINTILNEISGWSKKISNFDIETQGYISGLLNMIQENFYQFPERYDIEKIDYKKKHGGIKTEIAADLFTFFSFIQKNNAGMENYLEIAEKAFFCEGLDSKQFFLEYGKGSESSRLLLKLYERGSENFKNNFNQILDSLTENYSITNSDYIENILQDGKKTDIEKRLYKNVNEYFKKNFNIEDPDFAESLNYTIGSLQKNINEMSFIENEYPGGCALLNKNYNICEFGRYPSYILTNQISDENLQKPYGLIIFPRSDHNGAFSQMGDAITNIYDETKNRHLVRIFEAANRKDIIKIFLECNKKYGKENKISYLVLGGHGNLDILNLGSHMQSPKNKKENKYIFKNDVHGKRAERLNEYFVEKPAITLLSCGTGGEQGLIDDISNTYNAEVVAPKITTTVQDIHVLYDTMRNPHFKVTWGDENANSLYVAGEKLN